MSESETPVSRIVIEFVAPGSAVASIRGENVMPGQWAVAEIMVSIMSRSFLAQAMTQPAAPSIVRAAPGQLRELRKS